MRQARHSVRSLHDKWRKLNKQDEYAERVTCNIHKFQETEGQQSTNQVNDELDYQISTAWYELDQFVIDMAIIEWRMRRNYTTPP